MDRDRKVKHLSVPWKCYGSLPIAPLSGSVMTRLSSRMVLRSFGLRELAASKELRKYGQW